MNWEITLFLIFVVALVLYVLRYLPRALQDLKEELDD